MMGETNTDTAKTMMWISCWYCEALTAPCARIHMKFHILEQWDHDTKSVQNKRNTLGRFKVMDLLVAEQTSPGSYRQSKWIQVQGQAWGIPWRTRAPLLVSCLTGGVLPDPRHLHSQCICSLAFSSPALSICIFSLFPFSGHTFIFMNRNPSLII